jgi:HK97 family phage prohead protease
LRFAANLAADDPDAQKLLPKLRRGDLTDMSFSFRATDDEWSRDRSRRTVRAADIDKGDVSIVVHGANPATSLSLRRRGLSRTASPVVSRAHIQVAQARVRAARMHRESLN